MSKSPVVVNMVKRLTTVPVTLHPTFLVQECQVHVKRCLAYTFVQFPQNVGLGINLIRP